MGMPNSDDPAFTCVCREKTGDIIRAVRPLILSPANLEILYSRISKYPTFMGIEINTKEDMIRFFVDEESNGHLRARGICMVVDDFVGVFWLTDINGLFEASVHYTFFDGRQRGREDLCKKAIAYCFNTFKFHRLYTRVPDNLAKTKLFVERLGFKRVGKTRQSTVYNSKYYDTCIYDILQEDLLTNGLSTR